MKVPAFIGGRALGEGGAQFLFRRPGQPIFGCENKVGFCPDGLVFGIAKDAFGFRIPLLDIALRIDDLDGELLCGIDEELLKIQSLGLGLFIVCHTQKCALAQGNAG